MILNIAKLRDAGVEVRAEKDDYPYDLPDRIVIRLGFENFDYPKDLHKAIEALLPGMKIEADIIGARTAEKITAILLAQVIERTGNED